MKEFRYKAFISYSHQDEAWARWLHRSLEWYRVPKHLVGQSSPLGEIPRRLSPIFRDREELASASNLGTVLEEALTASESLIVICSSASAKSRWVNEEIRLFRNLGRSDRVFCLIVDGEPNAAVSGSDEDECFPSALREVDEDMAETAVVEPIAADVRQGGDGKQGAKLKLIAGLLGVGLDEIRQRENQRRQRRLIQIASGAVVGMLIAAVLATTALLARAEAERQTVRAEQQAETASQTSDFLVSLFDVVDPSENRGETITALEILDRGAARIDRELIDQPTVRSNLLNTMGRVYSGLGLYGKATELLDAAVEAGRITSDDSEINSARNLTTLAQALYLKGEYERAEAEASEAVRLGKSLSGPAENLIDALVVQANLRLQAEEDGAAELLFREALAIDEVVNAEPGHQHATILHGLGVSLFYQEQQERGISLVARALSLREQKLGEDHPQTFEAINDLSFFAYDQNDLAESERLLELALTRAEIVFGDAHPSTSTYRNNLARIKLEQGVIEQASESLAQAVAVDRQFRDPKHDDFAYSLNNLALTQTLLGNHDEAEALYLEALDIARLHKHRMEGSILANLADLQCRVGRAPDGLSLVEASAAALSSHRNQGEWQFAHLKSIEGGCHDRLGDRRRAEPLMREAYETLKETKGENWLFSRLAYERLTGAGFTTDAPTQ